MLNAVHPLAKLGVALVWLVASVLVFDAFFQGATIAIMAATLILLQRMRVLVVLALMVPFALFGFGFFTTSVLFRQESDFAISMARETFLSSPATSAGMVLFLRAIACGMVSATFAFSIDPGLFVRSLMATCRLPARVGYAVFSAMQLVPDLAAEAQAIRIARAMRAGRPPRRLPGPAEAFGLVIPLLAFAIRRAGRAAIAMEARGLSAGGARTILGAPRFHVRDAAFTAVATGALALCVLAAALR